VNKALVPAPKGWIQFSFTRLCTFFGPIFAREAKYSVINFAGRGISTPSEEFI
jgi:hypothetical protein